MILLKLSGFLFFVGFSLWLFGYFLHFSRQLAQYKTCADEAAANVSVARVKRDNLKERLVEIAREYAEYEKDVNLQVGLNRNPTIALLSALPSRFPILRANTQYERLLSNLIETESDIQKKVEMHNDFAQKHNSIMLNPAISRGFVISDRWPDIAYIHDYSGH